MTEHANIPLPADLAEEIPWLADSGAFADAAVIAAP